MESITAARVTCTHANTDWNLCTAFHARTNTTDLKVRRHCQPSSTDQLLSEQRMSLDTEVQTRTIHRQTNDQEQ
jgi:hypothetical protein